VLASGSALVRDERVDEGSVDAGHVVDAVRAVVLVVHDRRVNEEGSMLSRESAVCDQQEDPVGWEVVGDGSHVCDRLQYCVGVAV
jgi:hypothetical protein